MLHTHTHNTQHTLTNITYDNIVMQHVVQHTLDILLRTCVASPLLHINSIQY